MREFDEKVQVTVSEGAILRGVDEGCHEDGSHLIKNVTGAVYLNVYGNALMDARRKPR